MISTAHKRSLFWVLVALFPFYSFVVYTQGTARSGEIPAMPEQAEKGKFVFQQYNCISCHQVYGLGGYMGPDLTNVISTKGKAYAKAFLLNGTVKMPDFHLSEAETEALIAYLTYIDQTAKYPVRDFQLTWYGTFEKFGNETPPMVELNEKH